MKGHTMNEEQALHYAANLLEKYQEAESPDVDYLEAVEMLRRFAEDDYLRSGYSDRFE